MCGIVNMDIGGLQWDLMFGISADDALILLNLVMVRQSGKVGIFPTEEIFNG